MSVIHESAHLIGSNPSLMAILSLPPDKTNTRNTAVVILSSGLLHRTGPFRLHVDLARRLSMSGFATIRLDQSGRGDSDRSEHLSSAETIQQEILSAQNLLAEKAGTSKLIIVGLCSGADDALESTGLCEDIMGIIQLDGFAQRNWQYYRTFYLTRLLDPVRLKAIIANRFGRLRTRLTSNTVPLNVELAELSGIRNFPSLATARSAFLDLFKRGGAALCVFTGGIKDYYCYDGQLRRNLGLRESEDRLTEVFFPDANHTYPIVAHREKLVLLVSTWCDEYFD